MQKYRVQQKSFFLYILYKFLYGYRLLVIDATDVRWLQVFNVDEGALRYWYVLMRKDCKVCGYVRLLLTLPGYRVAVAKGGQERDCHFPVTLHDLTLSYLSTHINV